MKKYITTFAFLAGCCWHLSVAQQPTTATTYPITLFDLKLNIGIRAVAAINDSTCWFAGSNGVYGYTTDKGKSWKTDSIVTDTLKPEFRAMAAPDRNTVLLLCTDSPARLLKTTDNGASWRTVYINTHKQIFFDAMKFRDKLNGIAVSDPIDSCFVIIKTTDGGDTWNQVDCTNIPKAYDGEACFAASNTNMDFIGHDVWIGTGGRYSRILKSADEGTTWKAYETPVISGKQMTGIYTLDFFDGQRGIIAGGNYDDKEYAEYNKAATNDGGKTWQLLAISKPPGCVSCIGYQPGSNGKTIVASCLPGLYVSHDGGESWNSINKEAAYYTFQFSSSGKTLWMAGAKGKLAAMSME